MSSPAGADPNARRSGGFDEIFSLEDKPRPPPPPGEMFAIDAGTTSLIDERKEESDMVITTGWTYCIPYVMLYVVPILVTMAWLSIPLVPTYFTFIFTFQLAFYFFALTLSTTFFSFQLKSLGSSPKILEIAFVWVVFWGLYVLLFVLMYTDNTIGIAFLYNVPALYLPFIFVAVYAFQCMTHKEIRKNLEFIGPANCIQVPAAPLYAASFYITCIATFFLLTFIGQYYTTIRVGASGQDTHSQQRLIVAAVLQVSRLVMTKLASLTCSRMSRNLGILWDDYGFFFISLLFAFNYRNLFVDPVSIDVFVAMLALNFGIQLLQYPMRMTQTYKKVAARVSQWRIARCVKKYLEPKPDAEDHKDMQNMFRQYHIGMVNDLVSVSSFVIFLAYIRSSPNGKYFLALSITNSNYVNLLQRYAILCSVEIVLHILLYFALFRRGVPGLSVATEVKRLFGHRRALGLFTIATVHLMGIVYVNFCVPPYLLPTAAPPSVPPPAPPPA